MKMVASQRFLCVCDKRQALVSREDTPPRYIITILFFVALDGVHVNMIVVAAEVSGAAGHKSRERGPGCSCCWPSFSSLQGRGSRYVRATSTKRDFVLPFFFVVFVGEDVNVPFVKE
jgi:hypothetical protein